MKKLVNNKLFLPSLILIAFCIKQIIKGSSFPDALITISLIGLYSFVYFLMDKKDMTVSEKLIKDVSDIKQQVSTLSMKNTKPVTQNSVLGSKF